jgi:cell division protein FtsQ
MMKKVLNILVILVLVAYMITALGLSNSKVSETMCSKISITLSDSLHAGFFTGRDIEQLVLKANNKILGYPVKDINTREIESALLNNPYIKKADLFFNINGDLRVIISQRKPVIRIITRNQRTWYLDEEGYILPAKGRFAPFLIIANGYFTEGEDLKSTLRLGNLENKEKYKEWEDVLELVKYISEDKFLSSQIVQIYYNGSGDFELIPRVGAHQIIFGDIKDYQLKFMKLKVLYEEGLKYEGWNKYVMINLKYKNQVICTKR